MLKTITAINTMIRVRKIFLFALVAWAPASILVARTTDANQAEKISAQ